MLFSDEASDLIWKLREKYGAKASGVGPEREVLVSLWGDNDPASLRPAINKLQRSGFLKVEHSNSTQQAETPCAYNINDVARIYITEPLQKYCDEIESIV